MKRVIGSLLGALFALGVVAPKASAVTLLAGSNNDVFITDVEVLLDGHGSIKSTSVAPVVGDTLFGIINVQNIDALGITRFAQSISPVNQLSGVFAQKIVDITTHGGIVHFTLGNPTLSTYDGIASPFAAGEMFRLYTDVGGTAYKTNGPIASDVAAATDGTLWASLGLDATNGAGPDGLFGTADDTGYMYSHPINVGTTNVQGVAFGALNFKVNNTGYSFDLVNDINECEVGGGLPTDPVPCLKSPLILNQLVFTSKFDLNRTVGSPWQFASNDPGLIHPGVVPEVSSLWMLGMGLGGFGVFRRRKSA